MIVIRYTDFHHQHPLWSEPSQSDPQQLRQLPHLLLADQEVQERVTEVTLDHFLPKHFSFFETKESVWRKLLIQSLSQWNSTSSLWSNWISFRVLQQGMYANKYNSKTHYCWRKEEIEKFSWNWIWHWIGLGKGGRSWQHIVHRKKSNKTCERMFANFCDQKRHIPKFSRK